MWNRSYEKVFRLQVHFHTNQSHFHMRGFAGGLDLKQRHVVTREWPFPKLVILTRGLLALCILLQGSTRIIWHDRKPFWSQTRPVRLRCTGWEGYLVSPPRKRQRSVQHRHPSRYPRAQLDSPGCDVRLVHHVGQSLRERSTGEAKVCQRRSFTRLGSFCRHWKTLLRRDLFIWTYWWIYYF